MFESAIAYIVFNRPKLTEKTFLAIRKRRPSTLFIIADGPRFNHPTDVQRCAEVRAIIEQVDWPCTVHRNYAETNLGCKERVSSGLDWVFSKVERAIILEDDCLPHPDFFLFCDELLHRYEADERVWVVTGNNFQNGQKRGDASYYFSKYPHCWGWATWRRAWKHYQGDLNFWPQWQGTPQWIRMLSDKAERRYWGTIFNQVKAELIDDAWDYPWTASVWYGNGLTATPNVNLVTNIGFGPDATHTIADSIKAGVPVRCIGKMVHPTHVVQDEQADRYVFDHHFGGVQKRLHRRLINVPKCVLRFAFGQKRKFCRKSYK